LPRQTFISPLPTFPLRSLSQPPIVFPCKTKEGEKIKDIGSRGVEGWTLLSKGAFPRRIKQQTRQRRSEESPSALFFFSSTLVRSGCLRKGREEREGREKRKEEKKKEKKEELESCSLLVRGIFLLSTVPEGKWFALKDMTNQERSVRQHLFQFILILFLYFLHSYTFGSSVFLFFWSKRKPC